MLTKHPVSTFLWFEAHAAEAAAFYCSVFPDARVTSSSPMSTSFEIGSQRFIAFNGGPHYKLTAAVSVFVPCVTQAEVDALWDRFTGAGATESKCGWLVDQFGLSWQIIPTRLLELMSDPDPARAGRAVQAMLAMQKIDIAALERSADGGGV
jgi:predicted 3-demethylubiquinone-9 3-methyltransferase (glyoxalase superfamily)